MSKLLFYLALVLNLLIIIVTLPIFVIGIDNEYTVGLAEKAKLFFLFENVDIYILIIFFILLPVLNIYFLIKAKKSLFGR